MRLEGVAKAGYYPTPPSVVGRIAALIRPAPPAPRPPPALLWSPVDSRARQQ